MNIIEKLEALCTEYEGGALAFLAIVPDLRAIIEEYKATEQSPVFDLAKGLNHVADNGFWPNVLFDDNGNWCIADEGSSNVRMDDVSDFACGLVGEASWFKPTLEEAWDNYMKRLQENGNTHIDFMCAFTHPQPSDETVKDAERYRWLVENRFLNGVDLKADGTSHFMARGLIGRARSLKEAIDEAMKAKS